MPASVPEIETRLRDILSKSRFEHVLRVADTAKKLASVYQANEDLAFLAGLVHDSAKPMTPDTLGGYGISLDNDQRQLFATYSPVWHAFVGAEVVEKLFDINNAELIDSIIYHTTGTANMSLLSEILFVADFVEPGRKSSISKELYPVAFENLKKAIALITQFTIEKLISRNLKIHPFTVDCYNYYLSYKSE